MLDVANIADRKTCILGCNGIEVMYTDGNGFDEEEDVVNGIMVHGAASLPVLMIVQIEAHSV